MAKNMKSDLKFNWMNLWHGKTEITNHRDSIISKQGGRSAPTRLANSLGSIIAGFKSTVTKQINTIRQSHGEKVWQRNYYEHIVRTDESLNHLREYIHYNPALWAQDQFYD